MNISVKVKARAKQTKIVNLDNNQFIIETREEPYNGRANEAVRKILARHFNTTINKIKILKGKTIKNKIIKIDL